MTKKTIIDLTPIENGGGGGGGDADKYYVHEQNLASEEWNINHNLNKRPSIVIVDSADTVVMGEENYIDNNNLTIKFKGKFKGKAYLN